MMQSHGATLSLSKRTYEAAPLAHLPSDYDEPVRPHRPSGSGGAFDSALSLRPAREYHVSGRAGANRENDAHMGGALQEVITAYGSDMSIVSETAGPVSFTR